MTETKSTTPSLTLALLPVTVMLVVVIGGNVFLELPLEFLLLTCAGFTACVALFLGHTWQEILDHLVGRLASAFPAIAIILFVGILVGAWMASGTIPLLVYLGLEIISPTFILITAFLVSVILSVSTGTSWGSVGTVGVALMGVAAGMDMPLAAVAGAVISGAYFGDKMSPLSDSTNLACIATGADLYQHIKHMFWTTGPGFVVCSVVYLVAGFVITPDVASSGGGVQELQSALTQYFDLSAPFAVLLLVPPAIVIIGSIMKKPVLPLMFLSVVIAMPLAIFGQGFSLQQVSTTLIDGFTMDMFTDRGLDTAGVIPDLPKLVERGGMISMVGVVMVAFCAFAFVAALTVSGCLDVILKAVLERVRSTGQLIATTLGSGVAMIASTGNAAVSMLVLGGILNDEYRRRGLQKKNLSRTLEDSVVVVEPIIPWTLSGVYMTGVLGVTTLEYAPWAILCYSGLFFALVWGFTGIGIAKIDNGDGEDEESDAATTASR